MEKKKKFMLVFSLLMILSIASIGIKNGTSATPFIPTPDPPNENIYWDFDPGTIIGWEIKVYNGTTLLTSGTTLYNISALTFFTNYSGLGINYYGVQLKPVYFNTTTNSIEEYPTGPYMYPILNCSMANFTLGLFSGIPPLMMGYLIVNPFIPKNGTDGLMTEWSAYGMADEYSMFLGGDLNPDISFPNTNTILFENSTGSGEYVKLVYYDNGTLEAAELFSYFNGTFPQGISYIYTRTADFNPIDEIKWNIDIDDVFYMGFNQDEYKYEIIDFVNHTGYGLTGPGPFQSVIANVYIWDFLTETWILQLENTTIATVNEYMPYSPFSYIGYGTSGPQLLVPNGTTVDDMLWYFNILTFSPLPDIELAYGENFIKLSNSTNQEIIFYVEFTSEGIIKYLIDKMFVMMVDPSAKVYYFKNSEVISGMYNFNIEPYGTTEFQVDVNITVSEDTHLLYAGLDHNPTNKNLTNTLLVLDVFLNETSNLVGELNIIITYDPLKYEFLELWWFNYSADGGMGAWEKIAFVDLGNGTIIISTDHLSLFALVEGTEGPGEEIIPFGTFYVFFMILSIIGLIIYLKRKL